MILIFENPNCVIFSSCLPHPLPPLREERGYWGKGVKGVRLYEPTGLSFGDEI